jgi:uncharacterized protein with NAD-binding domain and iron-sulfur cluster
MAKVIILGGGVAGMSAAHELIDRGYDVEVFEKNTTYVGGKARSVDYFGDPTLPHPPYKIPLPGEHGFRFFPGFYKHVIDTMKRIPFTNADGTKSTVFNNLTSTSRIMMARYGQEPIVTVASFPKSLKDIELLIHDMHGINSGLTKPEIEFFAERVWQLITSSTRRRNQDYERLGWWQYLQADRFPGKDGKQSAYQSLLVQGLTRTLVAAQAKTASTKTGGNVFLQLIFGMTDPSVNTDRVLDGPTNDKWLNAWKDYLLSNGVKYHFGCEVLEIKMNKNINTPKVQSAVIKMEDGTIVKPQADYYILAVPVEQAARLINDDMIAADQTLGYIKTLAPSVSWMNGIQFYLNENVIINEGHVIYSDSEWAITSISQVQFWKDYDITTKGAGNVKGLLSVDVSDWYSPGRYTTKKCASECTRAEVAAEVWEQIKHSLNVNGKEVIKDSMRIDWFLDRDISEKATLHNDSINWNDVVSDVWKDLQERLDEDARETLKNDEVLNWVIKKDIENIQAITTSQLNILQNREPLLVNSVSTWGLRPEASCDISNLFLASDYVRTFTDLATMEGANEAARRAVNCLLEVDGNTAPDCKIWPLQEPSIFKPLKWYDYTRWKKGLPWTKHIPWWLKVFMVPWGFACIVAGFCQMIWYRIFPKK